MTKTLNRKDRRGKALTFTIVITMLAFSSVPIQSADEPNRLNICSVDANIAETKYVEKQLHIPTWLTARFDIILGFILGLFATSIVDCLRTRKKAKQFRHVACSELKQLLAELSLCTLHPDSEIDEEKIQLWWNSISEFNLVEATLPTEENEEYKRLKQLEMSSANIQAFVAAHNLKRQERCVQNKMMPLKKMNYPFISRNVETISFLNNREGCRLLNILRRIDALNSSAERMEFAFKKTFDGSSSHDRIMTNYYSECRFYSNFAKITAKEVAELIRGWQ
jgi:hypothetical protein